MKTETALERFRNTNSGKELLKNHSLDEIGVWRIRGEDPNCDFGGHHHEPELATVEGRLDDAIEYAVSLRGFWAWGSGGRIQKLSAPIKLDQIALKRRTAELKRIEELERELAELKARNGVD